MSTVVRYIIDNNDKHDSAAMAAEALDDGVPGLLFETVEEALAVANDVGFDPKVIVKVTFEANGEHELVASRSNRPFNA